MTNIISTRPAMRSVVSKFRSLLTRLAVDRRGNVAIAVAALMPIIIGFGGLALDTIQWIELKQKLQRASDSAAIAGSLSTIRGGDLDGSIDRSLDFVRGSLPQITIASDLSPEGHHGDPHAVGVRLTAAAPLTFSSMFMSKPFSISVNSTATVVETNDFCMLALRSGLGPGLVVEPGSAVDMECGVAVNSRDRAAVQSDASSALSIKKLLAQGGFGEGLKNEGRSRRDALQQKDPLQGIESPKVPNTGCPNITINAEGAQGRMLAPGCYGNLILDGQIQLQSGTYIINRGSIVFGPNAFVRCDRCTFFLTNEYAASFAGGIGSVKVHPNAVVQLSAPSDGPYRGLLMYQDRSARGGANLFSGNSRSSFEGILYFPNQDVFIDDRDTSAFKCSRFIGRRLILEGRIYVAKGCDADDGELSLKAAEVRLVG